MCSKEATSLLKSCFSTKKKKGPPVKVSLASEIKLGLHCKTSSPNTNETGFHERQAISVGNKGVMYFAGRLPYLVTLSVRVRNSFALSE